MTSVLQLGVGVVLLFTVVVVVVPAASHQWCNVLPDYNYDCQTYTLASLYAGRCLFSFTYYPDFFFSSTEDRTYSSQQFIPAIQFSFRYNHFPDLYLRPSPTFTNLEITIIWPLGSPTIINIGRNLLKQPNKWYLVQLMSDPHYDGLYNVYIDWQIWRSVRALNRAYSINVYVTGFLHYAVNCNPSHYPPLLQPPFLSLQPVPSPTTAAPPVKSTDDGVNLPTTVTVSPRIYSTSSSVTENGEDADEHSTTEDSGKPEDDIHSETIHQCLGLSWYIWVIIGAIVDVMVDVIAIAALVIMMKKETKEKQKTRQSQVTSLGRLAFSKRQMTDNLSM